jgi:hypothetical protein
MIEPVYSPQPVCSEHDLQILYCTPCCVRLFEEAGGMPEGLRHSWAMANLYKPKEAW